MKRKKFCFVKIAAVAALLALSVPANTYASAVVVAGGGSGEMSSQSGPGVSEEGEAAVPSELSGRVDYFHDPVVNPVVKAVEKYTYDQMVSDLNTLLSRYSDRMQVNTFGTSLDGRPLYEVILGNPNAGKHILIHAGIHAREYMTPLLVMKQLEYGLYFYYTGSYEGVALSDLLNKVAVHFVPMVNPDGISLSQNGIGTIRSEALRQTIRQCYASDTAQGRTDKSFEEYLTRWKSNARGVDLNQNFPADWEQVDTCPDPSYATYRGSSALSEPESQALAALANSRDWALTISYHSMGNVVYWDYAGNKVQPQSRELASKVLSNTGYISGGSSGHGGFKDWLQIRENPVPSITIETGGVACPLPLSQYQDIWYRNKMVWALAAKYAMTN